MHARGKKAPRCTRGSATCNYAYCGSSSFSLPVHVRFTLYPVLRWTKRTLVHDHLRPPREDPPASRATRDLYRCRRSSFLTNDTGEQQGYAIRGICLDIPLLLSGTQSVPSLARESKIGYAGHLNSPVIAIILPAWKIYTRGCYSCAIVRFHPEGGEKPALRIVRGRGDRDLRQAVEWSAGESGGGRCGQVRAAGWLIARA